jgi:hypothetical protein
MFARQLKCFSGTDRVAPTMKSVDGRINGRINGLESGLGLSATAREVWRLI